MWDGWDRISCALQLLLLLQPICTAEGTMFTHSPLLLDSHVVLYQKKNAISGICSNRISRICHERRRLWAPCPCRSGDGEAWGHACILLEGPRTATGKPWRIAAAPPCLQEYSRPRSKARCPVCRGGRIPSRGFSVPVACVVMLRFGLGFMPAASRRGAGRMMGRIGR